MAPRRGKKKKSQNENSSSSSPTSPVEINTDDVFTPSGELHYSKEFVIGQINLLKSDFTTKINQSTEKILNELRAENASLRAKVALQNDKIINLEKDVLNLQTYVRRNNIEVCGIDDNITTEDLEDKVIQIAAAINVKIDHRDSEACHRLKKSKKKNTQGQLSGLSTGRYVIIFINKRNSLALTLLRKNLNKMESMKRYLSALILLPIRNFFGANVRNFTMKIILIVFGSSMVQFSLQLKKTTKGQK